MNIQDLKLEYYQMPIKWQKHGDMPTQWEMGDDIEAYRKWLLKGSGVNGNEL